MPCTQPNLLPYLCACLLEYYRHSSFWCHKIFLLPTFSLRSLLLLGLSTFCHDGAVVELEHGAGRHGHACSLYL